MLSEAILELSSFFEHSKPYPIRGWNEGFDSLYIFDFTVMTQVRRFFRFAFCRFDTERSTVRARHRGRFSGEPQTRMRAVAEESHAISMLVKGCKMCDRICSQGLLVRVL